MKKFIVAAAFILVMNLASFSQQLEASTYLEQTHVSPKVGTAIGYQFGGTYSFEVGGFYQRSTVELKAEAGRPLKSENEFYGAFFAYPLLDKKITSIKFNVRTGVSNGENFVITPSLLADLKPLKNVSFGGGIGIRSFRPTYMASIKIKLNPANNNGSYLAFNN